MPFSHSVQSTGEVPRFLSNQDDVIVPSPLCSLFCFVFLFHTLTYLTLTCGFIMFFLTFRHFQFFQFQEVKSNKTVLHLAVKEGNIDLVRYLLRIPLPNMKEFVNMKVSRALT